MFPVCSWLQHWQLASTAAAAAAAACWRAHYKEFSCSPAAAGIDIQLTLL
jgi:hypothetical protein